MSFLHKATGNKREHTCEDALQSPKQQVVNSSSLKSKEQLSLARFALSLVGCFSSANKHEHHTNPPIQEISASTGDDKTPQPVKSACTPPDHASSRRESCVIHFSVGDLMKATDNFSPSLKIGQGGFGTVYRGKLKDGRLVAVKRAKKNAYDMQLTEEFRSELATLSNVEHLNLVKFIGYASDGEERILVVEYVSNGNLRQHLDGHLSKVLDLATRLDIAIDIAHALTYLHLYADRSIIHRDIKSTNILLTPNFRAKVADFGFSRTGPWELDATHVSTQVKGTAGYLDPEYLKTYQLTQKSDVYSFGILLIEIFTGRHPIEQKRDRNERMTAKWAFEMFREGRAIETLDPKLDPSAAAKVLIEKVLELALQCAAPTKQQRPSMRKAAQVLWNVRKDLQKERPHNSLSSSPSCSSSVAASPARPSDSISTSERSLLHLLRSSESYKKEAQHSCGST